MSGSGRDAISDVRVWSEDLSDVREWLGSPPGSPGLVGIPTRISGSGREVLHYVREWSGGQPGCA